MTVDALRAANAPPRRWIAGPLLPAGALLFLALTVYLPVHRCGFIWDDDAHVTQNATLRNLPGLGRIWADPAATPQYYPLLHTAFWIEHHLWGTRPLGYHLVNVLLHALSAVVLCRVLATLGVPGAWLASALFAVHPVHVESVAWITERKNVLSLLLALLATWAFLRARDIGQPRPPLSRGWYLASLLLFAGALLSKSVTAVTPAVLLVLIWWKHGRIARRDLALLAPMLLAGAAMGSLTVHLERAHVGAAGDEWDLSLLQRLLVAGRAIWFYAAKLLWPAHLVFFYDRWEIRIDDWKAYLGPAAVLLATLGLWLPRARIGRGPLAAWLIFCGVLAPALGLLNVYPHRYSFVADHFQYHASVAPLALAAAGLTLAFRRLPSPSLQRTAMALPVVVLAVLGSLTWRQIGMYRDLETLWRTTVQRNPRSWAAMNNLGSLYLRDGKTAPALELFNQSLAARPDYWKALLNRASAYEKLNRVAQALDDLERSIAVAPRPALPLVARANLYWRLGQLDRALADLDRAATLDSTRPSIFHDRGLVLAAKGRHDEAVQDFTRVLSLKPDAPEALNARAVSHFALGRAQLALDDLNRAIRGKDQYLEARLNRGQVLLHLQRWQDAADEFTHVLALSPQTAEAWLGRARAHAGMQNWKPSWADLRHAENLGLRDPDLRRRLQIEAPFE